VTPCLRFGPLPATANTFGSQAWIGGQGNGSKEVAPPDTTQWRRVWPPWRYGPTRAGGWTARETGGKVRRGACPPANKAVAGCGRPEAAFDPTGLIAQSAWERISYRKESGTWEPDGWAGSATAER